MADKVYARLHTTGTVTVLIKNAEWQGMEDVIENIGLDIELSDQTKNQCDIEVQSSPLRLSHPVEETSTFAGLGYVTLDISGTIEVCVRGDDSVNYGKVLKKMTARVLAEDAAMSRDAEAVRSTLRLDSPEILDAK